MEDELPHELLLTKLTKLNLNLSNTLISKKTQSERFGTFRRIVE